MIDTSLRITKIYLLKRQLSDALVDNDYDLQNTEILTLSSELDILMLPLFKEQLDTCKSIYYSLN